MDRNRIVLAVAISVLILFSWPLVMRKFFPTPPPVEPVEEQTQQTPVNVPPALKPLPHPPTQTPAAPVTVTQVPEREITVKTKYWAARISNHGAVATSWVLSSYPENGDVRSIKPAEGDKLELIPQDLPEHVTPPFGLRLPWSPQFARQLNQSNFEVDGLKPGQNEIDLSSGGSAEITFKYSSPEGIAQKIFSFSDDRFVIDVNATVMIAGNPQPTELVLGPRIGDQTDRQTGSYSQPPQAVAYTREGKREGFLGARITPQFTTITSVDHSANRIVLEKPLAPDVDSVKLVSDKGATLVGYARVLDASADRRYLTLDQLPQAAAVGTGVAQGTDTIRQGYQWAGLTDHYFTMLAVADRGQTLGEVTLTNFEVQTGDKDKAVRDYPSVAVPFSGSKLHVFVGPKDREMLLSVGRELGANLDGLIDWGLFGFAVRPLVPLLAWGLNALYKTFNNYGWAIVTVTIVINLLLSPLRLYSSKKMKKAAKHQPRLKELQERMKKLKENPKKNERELTELQQEQMAIMKEANPLGGCMPMLLQMPIFWAVYLYLGSSLDVRHQPWLGWIQDLSKPDHLYILPIVMCVTMIASTQLTPQPATADPSMKMQRVMMTWLMPIMLTWFFFFSAPSGLVLYWMVSNLIGVLIQLVINKRTAHLTADLAPDSKNGRTGGSTGTGKSGKGGKDKGGHQRRGAKAEGF